MNVSSASFWTPDYIPPSAWLRHGPFGFWLIEALRPKRFVEIGTRCGYSYFIFCQAIKRLGLETASFALDAWQGEGHAGCDGEKIFAAVSGQNGPYASFSTLMRGSPQDSLSYFGQSQIDLLHINDRHHRGDIRKDFESWREKLTDESVVLFHGTNAYKKNQEICEYFIELKAQYPSFEFVHGLGLGVLCPGKQVPEALLSLMSGDAEAIHSTRLAYTVLGDAVAERYHFQEFRAGVDALHRADADFSPEATAISSETVDGDLTLVRMKNIRAIERSRATALRAELDRMTFARDEALAGERAAREALAESEKSSRNALAEAREDTLRALARARDEAQTALAKVRQVAQDRINNSLAEARATEAASATQAGRLGRDIELLRKVLRGRDQTILRLSYAEQHLWSTIKVNDDLRRLLVRERRSPRHRKMRDVIAISRGQVETLQRSWTEERERRLNAERRLLNIERSRDWRLLGKLRSAAGRRLAPFEFSALARLDPRDAALASAVERTGLFDPVFYAESYPGVDEQTMPVLHFALFGWREGRRPNRDFDPADYLAHNPSVEVQGLNPLVHFADHGIAESLSALADRVAVEASRPVPLELTAEQGDEISVIRASFFFDPGFYAAANPDVADGGVDPAAHYVTVGWRELRDPSAEFDTAFYLSQNPDVVEEGANPLAHFIAVGQQEGRLPKAGARRLGARSGLKTELTPDELAAVEAVIGTGLFDADFYLAADADAAADRWHPAVHFALHGWREGRDPSQAFDTDHYLARNTDVARSGKNALVHYADVGAFEGRSPLPEMDPSLGRLDDDQRLARQIRETGLFDETFYRAQNPDVVARKLDPPLHFATHGWKEGRRPCPDFDPAYYLEHSPDIAALDINPLLHYAQHGISEGRRPSASAVPFTHLGSDYARWVEIYDTVTDADREAIQARLGRLIYRPRFSVVMPVYNTDLDLLRAAVESVRAQIYPDWELCIADDASTAAEVPKLLREFEVMDPRIRLVVREQNGHISAASNSALELATGEFVALMDHDDVLPEHALFTLAAYLNDDPEVDLIYSDEDHIDRKGRRFHPYFKTDYNPELMLGHNMVSHFGVYRRSIINEIGGFRLGYEGSQDYDLALRFVDAIDRRRILHIPHVLYHWRSFPGEATFSQSFIDRCIVSARKAIADHLERTGQEGRLVGHPVVPSFHRVLRPRPDPAPLVSVIVPTKDKADVLRPCCEGILQRTDYPNIELIVVDHESTDPAAIDYLAYLSCDSRVTVMPFRGEFNYSTINNAAVRQARGSVLAFLNNDVEVIEGHWLDEMVALAQRPEVGAVGAKLLYADGRVQHAGVILGRAGVAGHGFQLLDRDDPGDMGRAVLTMTVSAVTAACLVIRRELFERVGGFEEDNLAVTFNDIDLCLKVRQAGFRNVLAAHAVLNHHESLSRGLDSSPEKIARATREAAFMTEKWRSTLLTDPFYNPNFDLTSTTYSLAHPPRRKLPWTVEG